MHHDGHSGDYSEQALSMQLIDIDQFIRESILERPESMFLDDIRLHHSALASSIKGKSVLVVGGAGTIGSSYTKAILRYEPSKLVVVDTNENGLTELTRDLRSAPDQYLPEDYKSYPMSFGDPVFRKMFIEEGPFEIVANFAAHKHVRSEKDKFSVEAMLENNVFRAKAFLDLLMQNKPEHFFCVSTDKAANPVNVMGASKKLMEETIMAYSSNIPITTARFANVAFSNGSLLDGYLQRLTKSQPISCPSDVTRYFVSPEESGQICMLACMLGNSGDIFFPKLEDSKLTSFKLVTERFFQAQNIPIQVCESEEEAREVCRSRALDSPYPVYFFESDTSGEKQYEEFYTSEDEVNFDRFETLGIIGNAIRPDIEQIEKAIDELRTVMQKEAYDKHSIVTALSSYVPGFKHIETGKNLDQKM